MSLTKLKNLLTDLKQQDPERRYSARELTKMLDDKSILVMELDSKGKIKREKQLMDWSLVRCKVPETKTIFKIFKLLNNLHEKDKAFLVMQSPPAIKEYLKEIKQICDTYFLQQSER